MPEGDIYHIPPFIGMRCYVWTLLQRLIFLKCPLLQYEVKGFYCTSFQSGKPDDALTVLVACQGAGNLDIHTAFLGALPSQKLSRMCVCATKKISVNKREVCVNSSVIPIRNEAFNSGKIIDTSHTPDTFHRGADFRNLASELYISTGQ